MSKGIMVLKGYAGLAFENTFRKEATAHCCEQLLDQSLVSSTRGAGSKVYVLQYAFPISKEMHISNRTKVKGRPVEIAPACNA